MYIYYCSVYHPCISRFESAITHWDQMDYRIMLKCIWLIHILAQIASIPIFFFRFTAHLGLGFNTLFVEYYSVICRPSDHTVGGPRGPRFEPGTVDLEARTLITMDHHTSKIRETNNLEKFCEYRKTFEFFLGWMRPKTALK